MCNFCKQTMWGRCRYKLVKKLWGEEHANDGEKLEEAAKTWWEAKYWEK